MARYQWMKWLIGVSSVAAFTGFVGMAKEVDKNKQKQQTVVPTEAIVSTPQPSSVSTSVPQNDDVWQEWKNKEEKRPATVPLVQKEEVRTETKWHGDEKDRKDREDDEEHEDDYEDRDNDEERQSKKQVEKRETAVQQVNRVSETRVKTKKRQAEAVTRSHAS